MAAPWFIDGTRASTHHFIDGWAPDYVKEYTTSIGNETDMVVLPFEDAPRSWSLEDRGASVNLSQGFFVGTGNAPYKVLTRDWSQQNGAITGTEVWTRGYSFVRPTPDNPSYINVVTVSQTGSPDQASGAPTYSNIRYSDALTSSDVSSAWALVPSPFYLSVGPSGPIFRSHGEPNPPYTFNGPAGTRNYYKVGVEMSEKIKDLYSNLQVVGKWVAYEWEGASNTGGFRTTTTYEDPYSGDNGIASQFGAKATTDIDDLPWVAGVTDQFRTTSTNPNAVDAPSETDYIALPNLNAELDEYYQGSDIDVYYYPTDCRIGIQYNAATAAAAADGESNITVRLGSGTYVDGEYTFATVEQEIAIPTDYVTDISSDISSLISSWNNAYYDPEEGYWDEGYFRIEVVDGLAGVATKELTDLEAGFKSEGGRYASQVINRELITDPTIYRETKSTYEDYMIGKWEVVDSVESEIPGTLKQATLSQFTESSGGDILHSTAEEALIASADYTADLQMIGVEVSIAE
jgi:hypothetical protein